ncbi:MAG TPA: AgmX/PglI C-terminal domain-containing protein, partial [Polyangiaceae bacterium]
SSDDPEEMIALSGFGTSSDGAFGFGHSRGLGGMSGRGASHVRAPRLCGCDGVLVNGRLPPETIQRVVRESFGRFRACYEPALGQNPSLQGRVSTRFLVARDGVVSFSVDAGSDLPDARVVSCVVRAFTSVTFPAPAGGTVEVTYPIVFSPE